jgi:hypothetical protein
MSGRWHFYDAMTGIFTGQSMCAMRLESITRNTPPGCGAYRLGEQSYLTHRVHVETGLLLAKESP